VIAAMNAYACTLDTQSIATICTTITVVCSTLTYLLGKQHGTDQPLPPTGDPTPPKG
jgi:hypothetical protein